VRPARTRASVRADAFRRGAARAAVAHCVHGPGRAPRYSPASGRDTDVRSGSAARSRQSPGLRSGRLHPTSTRPCASRAATAQRPRNASKSWDDGSRIRLRGLDGIRDVVVRRARRPDPWPPAETFASRTSRSPPGSAPGSSNGKFLRTSGLSRKRWCRVVRFQGVLAATSSPARQDWADVAHRFGYADQAHLVREFVEFTGKPPTGVWWDLLTPSRVAFVQDETVALGGTLGPRGENMPMTISLGRLDRRCDRLGLGRDLMDGASVAPRDVSCRSRTSPTSSARSSRLVRRPASTGCRRPPSSTPGMDKARREAADRRPRRG